MSLWENDTGKKNCKNCEESCARAVRELCCSRALMKGVLKIIWVDGKGCAWLKTPITPRT
jgi:hypothetical protein